MAHHEHTPCLPARVAKIADVPLSDIGFRAVASHAKEIHSDRDGFLKVFADRGGPGNHMNAQLGLLKFLPDGSQHFTIWNKALSDLK